MKSDKDKEFEQNMAQLVTLLKKMMKNLPFGGGPFPGKQAQFKDAGINMNICMFSFLPMSDEDLDEIEDFYDQHFKGDSAQDSKGDEELTMDLSSQDVDFLRNHGIRF